MPHLYRGWSNSTHSPNSKVLYSQSGFFGRCLKCLRTHCPHCTPGGRQLNPMLGVHWVSTNEICAQPKWGMVRLRLLYRTLEVIYSSRFPLVGRGSMEERSEKPPKCHFWLTTYKETADITQVLILWQVHTANCRLQCKLEPRRLQSTAKTKLSNCNKFMVFL